MRVGGKPGRWALPSQPSSCSPGAQAPCCLEPEAPRAPASRPWLCLQGGRGWQLGSLPSPSSLCRWSSDHSVKGLGAAPQRAGHLLLQPASQTPKARTVLNT